MVYGRCSSRLGVRGVGASGTRSSAATGSARPRSHIIRSLYLIRLVRTIIISVHPTDFQKEGALVRTTSFSRSLGTPSRLASTPAPPLPQRAMHIESRKYRLYTALHWTHPVTVKRQVVRATATAPTHGDVAKPYLWFSTACNSPVHRIPELRPTLSRCPQCHRYQSVGQLDTANFTRCFPD